ILNPHYFPTRRSSDLNRPALLGGDSGLVVNRLTEQVEDAAEVFSADRHGNGRASIDRVHTAYQSVCGLHRNAANGVLTDVLRDRSEEHTSELQSRFDL